VIEGSCSTVRDGSPSRGSHGAVCVQISVRTVLGKRAVGPLKWTYDHIEKGCLPGRVFYAAFSIGIFQAEWNDPLYSLQYEDLCSFHAPSRRSCKRWISFRERIGPISLVKMNRCEHKRSEHVVLIDHELRWLIAISVVNGDTRPHA